MSQYFDEPRYAYYDDDYEFTESEAESQDSDDSWHSSCSEPNDSFDKLSLFIDNTSNVGVIGLKMKKTTESQTSESAAEKSNSLKTQNRHSYILLQFNIYHLHQAIRKLFRL